MALDFDTALHSALQTLLWSEFDDDGTPLDQMFGVEDITGEVSDLRKQLLDFTKANWKDIVATGMSSWTLGHDFILTRNGHGSGFWGHGYGDAGDRLTVAAHAYGETGLYVSDNGHLELYT